MVIVYAAVSLLFSAALVHSAAVYTSVVETKQGVSLSETAKEADLLPDGSLRISFSVDLRNPSRNSLDLASASWSVRVDNSSDSGVSFIPLATSYDGPGELGSVGPGETLSFEYEVVVSDPSTLQRLRGFVNHSAASGDRYTLETIPYDHDFRLVAWISGFKHDYDYYQLFYLNDLVRIDLRA